MEQPCSDTRKILKYWPIILLIGAFIFQFAQSQIKDNYQDQKLTDLTNQQAAVAKDIGDIKNSITRIETLLGEFNKK